VPPVRILLPPSETKSVGGDGAPLTLDRLALPSLTDTRRAVADALVELCSGEAGAARAALGLSASLAGEVTANRELWSSPTTPAVRRYTGVLYDALDAGSLTRVQRQRAAGRLYVGSALLGLVAADDPVPHYRLSAGCTLPALGASLRTTWRPALAAEVASWGDEFVVDLRSGSYRQLGPVPGAVTVRVETERADGTRQVVSHFNKHHKGLLARVLATSRAEIDDIASLLRVVRRAGMTVERPGTGTGSVELTMVVPEG